jgi:hypothetical protein
MRRDIINLSANRGDNVDGELSPSARYLRARAAHYRTLAAKGHNRARAVDYLDRARMLENSIESAPLTPATQTDIELAEGHVREGEERVATQLALIEKLDADGHHEQSRNERECWGP